MGHARARVARGRAGGVPRRRRAAPGARAILCVGVNAAAAFRPGGWLPRAAPDMHIEVWVWDGERIVGLASRP